MLISEMEDTINVTALRYAFDDSLYVLTYTNTLASFCVGEANVLA